MSQFISLKKNVDFQRVYKNGKSYANRYLIMYVLPQKMNTDSQNIFWNRIGISVSKKVGNSVVRHRIKRQIREICRLNASQIDCGYDIVIVVRREAKQRDYSELESAVKHLYKLHHLWSAPKQE